MIRTARFFVLFALVTATVAAAAQTVTTVRVFNLKNVSVGDAFEAIEPLLTDQGSVTVQPSLRRFTIQDTPQAVDRITAVMDELDRVPGEYRIEVEIVEGLDIEGSSDLPAELDRRLHLMFPFKGYRRVGQTVFRGELGQPTSASIGERYRLSFVAEAFNVPESTPWGVAEVAGRTQVKSLRLERKTSGPGGKESLDELLQTTVFLSPRQKMIIAAGTSEDSATGLVLILTMHSVEDR